MWYLELFMQNKLKKQIHSQPALSLVFVINRFMFAIFLSAGLLASSSLFLPANSAENKPSAPLKVGFVYTGSASDLGWNHAHDLGRQYLESTLKDSVVTTCAENIPENSDCERVMEKMIAKGNNLIFATSYGFLEPVLRVAARHPEVRFMHCGRSVPPGQKNVGSYFSEGYNESIYAAGIVAGKMTKTNKIGFIGGHPVPTLIWCINAFTLGARSVNPKATVHVVWINSWGDAALEAEAARGLLEEGCDVLNSCMNTSVTVAKTAEKAKAYSIGTNCDLGAIVPNGWLTGQKWNWGPLYVRVVQSIRNGSWKPETLHFSLADGGAVLASFGKSVPAPVQAQALQTLNELKQNKKAVFSPPLKDRDGKLRLASGEKADPAWLEHMNWFVSGVQGTLPKQ